MNAKHSPSTPRPRHARLGFARLVVLLGTLACLPFVAAGAETTEEDCGCQADQPTEGFFGPELETQLERQTTDSTTTRTRLDLFVMSLCPYGMQAQAQILPLALRFGDAVDLQLHFIADEADPTAPPAKPLPTQSDPAAPDQPSDRAGCAAAAVAGDGPFASLHGQPEIDEGRRQLVIAETWPEAFIDYVLCRSDQGPRAAEDAWQQCARRTGLDPQALQQAAQGPRGEALFRANIRLANQLDIDLSPTLLINGEEFDGPYEYNAVARGLCAGSDDASCAEIPACGRDLDCERGDGLVGLCRDPDGPRAACDYRTPAAFSLQVLESAACTTCDAEEFLQTTRQLFPGAVIQRLNASDPRASALAARHDVQSYPAFVFDRAFASTARFDRVRHLLRPLDDGGFSLDPRLNRTSYWPNRPLHRGRLDIYAPAAPQLEERLLALWPTEIPLRLHYLGAGPPADQGRRRACLAERFPEKALAYARARRAGGDWTAAAAEAGIDTAALSRCAAAEGETLRQKAVATARALVLEADGVAVLQDNRLLLRRATPEDLQNLWTPAPGRLAGNTTSHPKASGDTP